MNNNKKSPAKSKIAESADLSSNPLWEPAIKKIQEAAYEMVEEMIDEIKSTLESPPRDEDNNTLGMLRDEDGIPKIGLAIYNENSQQVASFCSTIDEFLQETEELYSMHEGWGETLIEDLEALKAKIQDRIDSISAQIDDDDEE